MRERTGTRLWISHSNQWWGFISFTLMMKLIPEPVFADFYSGPTSGIFLIQFQCINPKYVMSSPKTWSIILFFLTLLQVSCYVKEQLSKIDSGMSQITAESLFQLYLSMKEFYHMKDFVCSRCLSLQRATLGLQSLGCFIHYGGCSEIPLIMYCYHWIISAKTRAWFVCFTKKNVVCLGLS